MILFCFRLQEKHVKEKLIQYMKNYVALQERMKSNNKKVYSMIFKFIFDIN